MKKRMVSVLLCFIMAFGLLPAKTMAAEDLPFRDVNKTDWFYNEVKYVYERDLMTGISPTAFSPNETATRGMAVTILWNLDGRPAAAEKCFTDVAAGQYYTDAVMWAAANQIIDGYGDGKFGPHDSITREQLVVILYRYARHKAYDVTAAADLSLFSDCGMVSGYAVNAMAWAKAHGLITGVTATTLSPQEHATRAQIAAILMRFHEKFEQAAAVSQEGAPQIVRTAQKGTYVGKHEVLSGEASRQRCLSSFELDAFMVVEVDIAVNHLVGFRESSWFVAVNALCLED